MNSEVIVLVTQCAILLSLAICAYRRGTYHKMTSYAISVFAFSSIMAIVFYFQPLSLLSGRIQAWPVAYWISIFLITLIPIYQFDQKEVVSFSYNEKIFYNIAKIGFIISIIPFFEQLITAHGIVTSSNLGDVMVDLHDEGSLDNMSIIGRNMLRLNIALYDLSFVILLLEFIKPVKNKWVLFYLFFIIATRNLTGILAGHRSAAIEVVLKVLMILVIVLPMITANQRKIVIKTVSSVFIVVGAVFAVITIGRQMLYSTTKGDDFTLLYFLSWYAGESLVNFNQWLPDMKNTTDGIYTCWYWLKLFGFNPHDLNYDYMYGHLQSLQGIPQNIFYTYIGNFVQDFGFAIAAIYLVIQSFIFKSLTRFSGNVMPASSLFMLFFYVSIIVQGVTSYQFNGEHGKFFIWSFLVYFYLRSKKM